eukprot:3414591-Rhodomonas_salina.1
MHPFPGRAEGKRSTTVAYARFVLSFPPLFFLLVAVQVARMSARVASRGERPARAGSQGLLRGLLTPTPKLKYKNPRFQYKLYQEC